MSMDITVIMKVPYGNTFSYISTEAVAIYSDDASNSNNSAQLAHFATTDYLLGMNSIGDEDSNYTADLLFNVSSEGVNLVHEDTPDFFAYTVLQMGVKTCENASL